jgi:C4-dicarboxylate-specific signal transduction histidine kinase
LPSQDSPKLEAVAALISEAAARGAGLTSHLLAFARGQPSQPRAVDVSSLLVDHADALLLAKPCRKADLANLIRTTPAPDSIVVNVKLT